MLTRSRSSHGSPSAVHRTARQPASQSSLATAAAATAAAASQPGAHRSHAALLQHHRATIAMRAPCAFANAGSPHAVTGSLEPDLKSRNSSSSGEPGWLDIENSLRKTLHYIHDHCYFLISVHAVDHLESLHFSQDHSGTIDSQRRWPGPSGLFPESHAALARLAPHLHSMHDSNDDHS
eukprot:COSAG02_NODE_3486_length_6663_cov_612.064138_3_plen_179_part_00